MPVAADLQAFASLNMPDDDVGTSGGAIDLTTRVDFTPIAVDDDLEVVSDNAGDTTPTCTIEVRKTDGSVDSEVVTLTGITPVVFATLGVVERILKCTLSTAAAGIVTLQRSPSGATVRDIPVGELGFVRMFRKSASEAAATTRYEKFYWKNTHSTEALLGALVKQSLDPTAKITHDVALAVDDSVSVADRKTAPPSLVFDDNDKAVPGTDLGAGVAIGVWLLLSLDANNAAIKDTYTSELSGTSV
ncbi:hypothetical protein LCGC14_0910170 [marine sediment metagenome]|uniref:Uncharacterized protein n=1 Tax=marine sediment metagenome TaxID=412755 RepID=A0A0F9PEN6_9ZZZZ